jgi:hypothetical protein
MSFRAAYGHRRLVYGISFGLAIVTNVAVVVLSLTGRISLPFSIPTMLILITLIFMIYPNFMEFANQRWRRRVDDAIPALLTDITANVKTGINLDRALELAAGRDYGPLTSELKKLQTQLQLGVPFEEAMNLLSGVRLGVGLNLIPQLSVYTLNKLLIYTQPAHLAALDVRAPTDQEQRAARAAYVRQVLVDEAARAG